MKHAFMRDIIRWIHPKISADYVLSVRLLELSAIVIFVLIGSTTAAHLIQATHSMGSRTDALGVYGLIACLAVIAGFLCADLISGLIHFWCDHIASEKTPILGPIFVKHFLAHHNQPADMVRHDFIETNGNNFVATTLLLIPGFLASANIQSSLALVFFWGYLSTCVFLALTNQSHKWAHQTECHPWVRHLQNKGLLLSRTDHALHHRQPFNRHFCITSGMLNKPLERIGFFTMLGAPTPSVKPNSLTHSDNTDKQA